MNTQLFSHLPRVSLAHLPTPLEAMPRLSQALGGPQLFVKRDDQTGLAGGGNKTRKLEFVLADALRHEADTIITTGAMQSNHARQTAAAAARYGLHSVLVLRGSAPDKINGNLLLDRLLGAEVVWAEDRSRDVVMDEVAEREKAAGRTPYTVPGGASVPLGITAYALAMFELQEQMEAAGHSFDRIVFGSGSGGTHAGLVVGASLTGFRGEILGISIDRQADLLRESVARLATETAQFLGKPHSYRPEDISVNADYHGQGYSILGPGEREAIELFARNEGLLLDPVYAGRAAAGLIDLIRKRVIGRDERVLFWHTGGTPALFAYADELIGSD